MTVGETSLTFAAGKRTIVGLDVIRFVAALIVVLYHLFFFRNLGGPDPSQPWILKQFWFGWVGVEIFFVISGCVIAFSAESLSAISFLKHRVIRLYPTVWICATMKLLAILFFLKWMQVGVWLRYLRTVVLWPHGQPIDAVYWTLQIEVMFYGLIAVILALKKYEHLMLIMAWIGSASTVFWLLITVSGVLRFSPSFTAYLDVLANNSTFGILLGHHGCFFAIGVFIFLLYKKGHGDWKLYILTAFCALGGMCEVAHTVAYKNAIFRAAGHSTASQAGAWLAIAVWGIAVLTMLLVMRFNQLIISKLKPALGTIRFLGLMTFPLYLVQTMGEFFSEFIQRRGYSALFAENLALVSTLVVAAVITAYIEPPARKLLKSLLMPTPPALTQPGITHDSGITSSNLGMTKSVRDSGTA